MIIDSSAMVAIVRSELYAQRCLEALESAKHVSISAGTFLETSIVIDSSPASLEAMTFEDIMLRYEISIEAVTEAQARIARQAHRRYGRGSGHPAHLNFGDCFAYALARDRNEPLLFVGNDFIHTDIRSALVG